MNETIELNTHKENVYYRLHESHQDIFLAFRVREIFFLSKA